MQRTIRIAMVSVAIAAMVVFLVPSDASAQVRVEGRFRLPHGDIAIGVGDPYYGGHYGYHRYPVGSYVPYGHRVVQRARYGYGFNSPVFACRSHGIRHAHWVPVRRVRTRWVVVAQPVLVQEGYAQPYYDRGYYDDGYSRPRYREDRRSRGDRRYRRDRGAYSGDPYYDFNREYWDRNYRNPYARHVHTDDCDHDD